MGGQLGRERKKKKRKEKEKEKSDRAIYTTVKGDNTMTRHRIEKIKSNRRGKIYRGLRESGGGRTVGFCEDKERSRNSGQGLKRYSSGKEYLASREMQRMQGT